MEQSVKQAVQSQFGRNAEAYVKSVGHAKGEDLKKLMEIFQGTSEALLLDIATGGGHVANALSPLVKQVTALDITSEILLAAEQFVKENGRTNISFVQGDAENLPFSTESFDMVTCRIAPHHFPQIPQFVKETMRVLKKGGVFYLIDNVAVEDDEVDRFYNEIEKRRDFSHQRALKKTEWISLIESFDFELVELHSFKKKFKFDSWCERMKMSVEEKESLMEFMLSSSPKIKQKLKIRSENHQIISFEGESILVKAIKPNEKFNEETSLG